MVATYSDRLLEAMRGAIPPKDTAALAESIGVSYQAVRKVLNGGKFGTQNNIKAAATLGVSSEWLATGIGPKKQSAQDQPRTVADAIKAEAQQDPYELIERGLRALVIVGDDFKAVMAQVRELAAKSEEVRAAWQERLKEAGKNGA